MKTTDDEVVIEVTPQGRTWCPCCGQEGRLVRTATGHNSTEVLAEVVVDVHRARHSAQCRGLKRFEIRIVEKLGDPPAPPTVVKDLPRGWEICPACHAAFDPWNAAAKHIHTVAP